MKIAQIVCTFPPYKGGIGNSVYNFSKYLAAKGENVTVFTPNYQNVAKEYNENFKVRRLNPLFKIGNAAVLPQLFWKLKDFDVIHLHLPFIGGTLPAIFYPKKKLVIHYHMDLVGSGAKKIIFWFYKKVIMSFALRRADKIIVSSFDYIKNSDIASYFEKRKEKFFELPFGVDAEKFFPKSKNENLMEKYFIEPASPDASQGGKDDKVILFVGGLDKAHYFKGLDVLMRAIKEIDRENVKLLIVGEGDMKADYKDKAEELHLSKKVVFAGSPNDAELPNYYNLADIFVLPSIDKSEAFGLVLLEAAACGKPLIASDLLGVRTVVWKNENGLLAEPNNSKDLADKIKQLLDDDELRVKIGANARQIVENNYCWKKITRDLITIYNS